MGAETPKQFLELDGTPIVMHSLRRIASCELVTDIIVATRGDVVESLQASVRGEKFAQKCAWCMAGIRGRSRWRRRWGKCRRHGNCAGA